MIPMLERIYLQVPNVAFHKIVKEYAFYMGKPVFTIRDLDSALINYINLAKTLN
jgi:hypothetical protein